MKKNSEKANENLSLYDLYTKNTYYLIPLGAGEWKPYPALLREELSRCKEGLWNYEGRHYLCPKEKEIVDELEGSSRRIENELLKLTRFDIGELPTALKHVTGVDWKFAHRQKFNKDTSRWELKLSIEQEKGRFHCDYFTFALTSGIVDITSFEEIKSKICPRHLKEDIDAALVYFLSGDPQLPLQTVKEFTWKPFAAALDDHLKHTYLDMDLYNSFGPAPAPVLTPNPIDDSLSR